MKKPLAPLFLVIVLGLTALLSSCGILQKGKDKPLIALYPLKDTDYYDGKNPGDVCFSEFYLNEILQAKIENR